MDRRRRLRQRVSLRKPSHSLPAWTRREPPRDLHRYLQQGSLPVIPPDLVERFVSVRYTMDIFPPYLYQEVLADFIIDGHFTRHIRKMRQIYGERRKILVHALHEEFRSDLPLGIHGTEAGMHLAVTLPEGMQDLEIAIRAVRDRLWLWPLSPSFVEAAPRHGFILGFGSTAKEQIPRAVRLMRTVIGEFTNPSS
jgi:GntR family transcriptional regulator/MocR family aminotransferase